MLYSEIRKTRPMHKRDQLLKHVRDNYPELLDKNLRKLIRRRGKFVHKARPISKKNWAEWQILQLKENRLPTNPAGINEQEDNPARMRGLEIRPWPEGGLPWEGYQDVRLRLDPETGDLIIP